MIYYILRGITIILLLFEHVLYYSVFSYIILYLQIIWSFFFAMEAICKLLLIMILSILFLFSILFNYLREKYFLSIRKVFYFLFNHFPLFVNNSFLLLILLFMICRLTILLIIFFSLFLFIIAMLAVL